MSEHKGLDRKGLSRRSFIAGSAAGMAATVLASAAPAIASESKTASDWMPETWDYEADAVVVGYGSAGAAAAITLTSEDLGDVIVLEAAPQEVEGGNSRVAGQIVLNFDSEEGAFNYQKELNGAYTVDDDLLHAWAKMLGENIDWLDNLDADMQPIDRSAEFAAAPNAEEVHVSCVGGSYGNGSLWYFLKDLEDEYGYQVINNARVTSIVRNPLTNEACGAIAQLDDGTSIAVKARKGVILSCGGYENAPEIVRNTFSPGCPKNIYVGTPYNRGDGMALVEPFGVQLWHMNNFSGSHLAPYLYEDGYTAFGAKLNGVGWIYVGTDATRFMYEESNSLSRHGKIRFHGTYMNYPVPENVYMIMGAKAFEEASPLIPWNTLCFPAQSGLIPEEGLSPQDVLDMGMAFKADTVEELAGLIGMEPERLADTVEKYNGYCKDGCDPDFHRGEAYYEHGLTGIGGGSEGAALATEETVVIEPFDLEAIEGPYYAMEMRAVFINTQGGARRDANCQLVNSHLETIPRLYGAGEFGSIYGYEYNGGGNLAEALATGRTAARHLATLEPWE